MNNFHKVLDSLENKAAQLDIAKMGTITAHDTGSNTVSVAFDDGTPALSGLSVAGMNGGGFSIKQELKPGDKTVVLMLDSGTGGSRNLNNAICLGALGGTVEPDKLVISGDGVKLELSPNKIDIQATEINLTGNAKLNGKEIKTE